MTRRQLLILLNKINKRTMPSTLDTSHRCAEKVRQRAEMFELAIQYNVLYSPGRNKFS